MSKVSRRILLAVGIFAVVLAILLQPIYRYQRVRCRDTLKLLGSAIRTYQGDHQGQLPRQLAVLSNELSNPVFLVCPGSGHSPGSFTNADSWADYTFIDWPVFLGTNAVANDLSRRL